MKKVLRIIFGLSAVLVCMLVSCKKYSHTTDDLKGNNYIAGIAYMYDDYSINGTLTPMTNLKVANPICRIAAGKLYLFYQDGQQRDLYLRKSAK